MKASIRSRLRLTMVATAGAIGLVSALGYPATAGASPGQLRVSLLRAGGASAQVAAAKAFESHYTSVPKTINQKTPLTRKVKPGRTYVVITCELPQCQTISDGAVAAAKTIGWKPQVLSYKTTDGSTLTAAMKQALQYNPIAVGPIGFSQSLWTSLIPTYHKAGVIIAPIAVGDVTSNPTVPAGSSSGSDYRLSGKIMANWFIADSKAKGNALVVDTPAFYVLKAYGDSFKASVKQGCTACKLTALDLTPAQLASNGVIPAIVAALQRDSSIKYLVSTDGAFLAGLPSSLKAAGITGIKICGGAPDINNMQALASGTESAWTGEPTNQFGWVGVDIAARASLGMKVTDADGGRPQQLFTPANVGTPQNFLASPANFRTQFMKLWHV